MLPTAEIRLGTSLCIALSALGRTIMTTLRRLPHVLGLRKLCEPRRLHPPFGSLPCLDGCLHAHRPVRRWTEIDLGWLVSSETLLPPRADGSPQRRVPVIVMEELPRWQEEDFFTFYPALAAFLDIPPGLVAGGSRTASPSRPFCPRMRFCFGLRRFSELVAIDRLWEDLPQRRPTCTHCLGLPLRPWGAHQFAASCAVG